MVGYSRSIVRYGWVFLLACVAAAGWAGWLLPGFSVDAGTDVLLNEDDDDLYFYNQTRADWGTDEYLIVCCHRKTGWFDPEGLGLLNGLVQRLRALPHAKDCTAITTVPLLRNRTGAFGMPSPITLADRNGELDPKVDLEKAKAELLEHTQASGNLISASGKDASILVYLDVNEDINRYEPARNRLLGRPKDPDARKELARIDPLYKKAKAELARRRGMLVQGVREVTREFDPKLDEPIRLSGLSFINIVLMEHIQSDIMNFGVLSLGVFTLTFLVIYRKLRWVFLPIVTCVLPVVLMLAVMVASDKKVTIVTSNMPVLLFVLMLPYTVYFIERYRERRASNPDEDVEITSTRAPIEIFPPCFFSGLATMAGTLAHTPSGISPVRTFGWMMTLGIAIGLGIFMTFLPSAVVRLKPVAGAGSGSPAGPVGPLKLLERLVLHFPKPVVIASLVILGLSLWGTSRITVETKFIDYFWSRSPIYQGLDYIDNRMGGTTPLEVILRSPQPGTFKTPEGLKALDAVARFFDREKVPETGNVRSFKTFVDEARKAIRAKDEAVVKTVTALAGRRLEWKCGTCGKARLEPMKEGLPREPVAGDGRSAACSPCGRETEQKLVRVDPGLVGEFCNWDFSVSRVLVRMKETAPSLNRDRILRQLEAHLASLKDGELRGIEARPTGIFLLYSNMLNTLLKATRETFILAVIAIFVMLCFLFRSAKLAILVLLPQILPVFLVLGTMGFTGIALDMVTVIIASVAMGVGIDAAIQYTVRFRIELAASGGDIREAVRRSHATIGRAIFIATSIVFAGFVMLMLSNFVPTFYFGLFTGLAILMGLFASLTTLPSMFVLLDYPKLKQ